MVKRHSRRACSGREALPESLEWLGGTTGGPGMVKRPFRRAGCILGVIPGGLGVVGRPSRRVGRSPGGLVVFRRPPQRVGRPSQRAESGREAISEGWEALPENWEWSRGPSGGPRVV